MRIHAIKHAAVVLGVTSPHAEGEAGALLQTFAQRRTQQSARRPDAALALHVAHEAGSAFGDHLAGRTVARIAVARDHRLDPSAIRPGPPRGIDPATASHEGADANDPTGLDPVVRSEAGPTQSSHVATGRLDILFGNSQFRNMLEWEDPTAQTDELTKAGTER